MHFPDRPRTEARNQLMLNLARDDVKEYVFGFLDKLAIGEQHRVLQSGITTATGRSRAGPRRPPADQKKIWVRYVQNLYEILDRLRAAHPKLEIESCSGGGGRVDLGILRRVDQVWTSDNTEAYDRLRIQEGFSYRLHGQNHDGVGDGCSQHERPQHAAEVPVSGGHDGLAWALARI